MRLIVAMTGATGAVYGICILKALQHLGVERHVILSRWAEVTIVKETGLSVSEVCATASVVHKPLKGLTRVPRVIITDHLASCGTAKREISLPPFYLVVSS
jgi:hypothetical protein